MVREPRHQRDREGLVHRTYVSESTGRRGRRYDDSTVCGIPDDGASAEFHIVDLETPLTCMRCAARTP